jgi:hypothetical protein
MNDFEMRRQLRELAAERSPPRDLWPGIAARLASARDTDAPPVPSRKGNRWLPLALAASALLAAVLMWPPPADMLSPPPPADVAAIDGAHSRADPDMGEAHAAMLREVEAMRFEFHVALAQLADVPLPPEWRAVMRELKDSEQSLREALEAQPDSTWLLAQLRRTYEQRLKLGQLAAVG